MRMTNNDCEAGTRNCLVWLNMNAGSVESWALYKNPNLFSATFGAHRSTHYIQVYYIPLNEMKSGTGCDLKRGLCGPRPLFL